MIKCKPERSSRQAILLVVVCAAVFLASSAVSSAIEVYRWAAQAISLAALTIGIFLVYRYTMVEMIYSVGGGTFSVSRKVGNRETTVLSLDVSTAKALITKKQFKEGEESRLYVTSKNLNFNQNMRPSGAYVYVTEFNGKLYAIEFEPNAPFVEALLREMDEAKGDDEKQTDEA